MADTRDLLLLGDALEEMEKLPAGEVDMLLVDLPYGTTANKWDTVLPFEKLWPAWRRVCKPGAPMVLFTQQPFTTIAAASNLKNLRTEWIWQKAQGTGFLNAKRYPLKAHENVLVFCDRTPHYRPQMSTGRPYNSSTVASQSPNYGKEPLRQASERRTARYPQTLLSYAVDQRGKHPTQKPTGLCEYLIETYSHPGDTVLDCCMGSGSTGVAALRAGRGFIGIELDPNYFVIAAERIGGARTVDLAASEGDEVREFILLDCAYNLLAEVRTEPVDHS